MKAAERTFVMKLKKITVGIIVFSLLCSASTMALAEGNSSEQVASTTSVAEISNSEPANSAEIEQDNTLSDELIAEFKDADLGEFSQLQFGLNNYTESVNMLNMEYAMLSEQFASMGYGTYARLEIPEFQSGYSESIVDRFAKNFGDLTKTSLLATKIPEDWDVSKIMSDSIKQRDDLVSGFTNSEAYKNVVNHISIGNIFNEAKKIKSMPSLQSSSELSSYVKAASASTGKSIASKANSALANANSKANSLKSTNFDAESIYSKAIADNQVVINNIFNNNYKRYIEDTELYDKKSTPTNIIDIQKAMKESSNRNSGSSASSAPSALPESSVTLPAYEPKYYNGGTGGNTIPTHSQGLNTGK